MGLQCGGGMMEQKSKNGAQVNQWMFLAFYQLYGVHPKVLPWHFLNIPAEELWKRFDGADVNPEEIPA